MVKLSAITRELRLTLALALPMIVGQVSQMLIGITDAALIGRVGTVELAAAAFTHGVFGLFYIVGIGLLLPVGVFTARDHGAGDPAACGGWLKHGRALALMAGGAAFLLLAGLSTQLHRFGQPPEVVAVVRPFFLLCSLSLIPVFYFQVQRQYLDALGRPWVGTSIMLADVALNALLNWMFIWGNLGAPALGFTGSGVATLLARILAVAAIAIWLRREQAPAGRLEQAKFRAMMQMGVPAAGSLLFESGAFTAAALMMGWLGATALAAHQIALSCAAFTFMVPLGLAMATSIRISKARGEGRPEVLRAIGFGSLGLSSLVMLSFATVFTLAGTLLARGFTPDGPVVELAARLLVVAAVFQLFDGGQVVAAGALRGMTDVKIPTVITFIAYWVLSLPVAYLLAFHTPLGPIGIWSGLAIGLACAAVLLVWRFHRLTRLR
ncbi:Multidrug resistance protein NorM [Lacunisphaera limnophila]|uniref:Multidrug-efflux transporter n=1 Tax=Lacunisphaera limnophila TaxID=1838286 RepID=A0A1D8AU54_9BACT|nr:MATE family efflux transporter [Lacunisphaera limnophila]AOS44400.1 Multidrug resistance protein NorM [Lacunisphaera limnophila]